MFVREDSVMWLLCFLLMQIFTQINFALMCPDSCACLWKGGKQHVECVDRQLMSILPGIDHETQVLDYSKNNLFILQDEIFYANKLIHLQKLYLSHCRVSNIRERAFYGLSNLIDLDISHNALQRVPTSSFAHCPLLMKLNLAGNPVRELQEKSFQTLAYLINLDLSNCQIQTIKSEAFDGLTKLEWLKLDGNDISTVSNLDTFPAVINGASWHNNPWLCDCSLKEFAAWIRKFKNPFNADPVCRFPNSLKGVSVYKVDSDKLACIPTIVPSSLYVEIPEGKNISFVCRVQAIPEATISWEYQNVPVENNSFLLQSFYSESQAQISEFFIYDAAIKHNGTYKCVAGNIAGKTASIFTVNVIPKPKIVISERKPVPYLYMITSAIATLIVILIVVILALIFRKQTSHSPEKNINKFRRYDSPCVDSELSNPDLLHDTEDTSKVENNESTAHRMRYSNGTLKCDGTIKCDGALECNEATECDEKTHIYDNALYQYANAIPCQSHNASANLQPNEVVGSFLLQTRICELQPCNCEEGSRIYRQQMALAESADSDQYDNVVDLPTRDSGNMETATYDYVRCKERPTYVKFVTYDRNSIVNRPPLKTPILSPPEEFKTNL